MKVTHNFDLRFILNSSNILVTFVNPYSYYILEERTDLVDRFDCILVDGISLVLAYNFFSKKKIERYSFDLTSVAKSLFELPNISSFRVALIGGKESEVLGAMSVIKSKFAGVDICYTRSGYFDDDNAKEDMINELSEVAPDIVIVGAGTPLQEELLVMISDRILFKVGFTCGGFLTQISQNDNYFNPLLNKFNLRWLQRFIRHDYVRRRVLIDYPLFFARYFSDKFLGLFK